MGRIISLSIALFFSATGLWSGPDKPPDDTKVAMAAEYHTAITTSPPTTTTTLAPTTTVKQVYATITTRTPEGVTGVIAVPIDRGAAWDAVAQCETGGNWAMHGSTFSGGLGFANSTWAAYNKFGFPANAGDATREQQIQVAETINFHGGCWWKATGRG